MLISFEGIDNSGKTTQIAMLDKYLHGKQIETLILREPGGTEVSEHIRNILLMPNRNIHPIAELLLFAAARRELVEKLIKPALNRGKVVVCDRYYDSTTAYQGWGRGIPMKEVQYCNEIATSGIKPDITFYLDIPLEISKERHNGRNADRMEASGDEFFTKVIDGFRSIAASEPERIITIDGSLPAESIHAIIVKNLEEFSNK
ncbi:MAG: dTMP kinase [Ignavibacteria bacterium]|nr:dTMP kinase [Ignavibacteria bacterium]